MKKIFIFVLLFCFVLACQTHREDFFIGDWIEEMPVNKHIVQGISLKQDGAASSIGMATLKYEKWQLNGNQIIFIGKSIGNGQTIDFEDKLDIIDITSEAMVLGKYGKYQVHYKRKK